MAISEFLSFNDLVNSSRSAIKLSSVNGTFSILFVLILLLSKSFSVFSSAVSKLFRFGVSCLCSDFFMIVSLLTEVSSSLSSTNSILLLSLDKLVSSPTIILDFSSVFKVFFF